MPIEVTPIPKESCAFGSIPSTEQKMLLQHAVSSRVLCELRGRPQRVFIWQIKPVLNDVVIVTAC